MNQITISSKHLPLKTQDRLIDNIDHILIVPVTYTCIYVDKIQLFHSATSNCYPLVYFIIQHAPHWFATQHLTSTGAALLIVAEFASKRGRANQIRWRCNGLLIVASNHFAIRHISIILYRKFEAITFSHIRHRMEMLSALLAFESAIHWSTLIPLAQNQ